jgi:predicted RNase H-like nuclease
LLVGEVEVHAAEDAIARVVVAGVDACREGWVAVLLAGRRRPGVTVAADFATLLERIGPLEVIGVDIPIGLPKRGFRQLDLEARRLAGPRRHSVFVTAPRAALEAGTHADAVAVSRGLTGQGLSRQSYGLRTKIFEVEACLQGAGASIREVHPELSFAAMKGHPADWPKRSYNGMMERRALLEAEGIRLPGELPGAGSTAVDDVLDAAAAAWTARRIAAGRHRTVPEQPETDGRRPIAIHI